MAADIEECMHRRYYESKRGSRGTAVRLKSAATRWESAFGSRQLAAVGNDRRTTRWPRQQLRIASSNPAPPSTTRSSVFLPQVRDGCFVAIETRSCLGDETVQAPRHRARFPYELVRDRIGPDDLPKRPVDPLAGVRAVGGQQGPISNARLSRSRRSYFRSCRPRPAPARSVRPRNSGRAAGRTARVSSLAARPRCSSRD